MTSAAACDAVVLRIVARLSHVCISDRANRSWLIKDSHLSSSKPLLCFASNKIDSHPCTKCQAPMVLTGIKTARLAFDIRTFECFNCDNVDKIMTETNRGSTYDPTAL